MYRGTEYSLRIRKNSSVPSLVVKREEIRENESYLENLDHDQGSAKGGHEEGAWGGAWGGA